MGISNYFTQSFELFRKNKVIDKGVVKETLTSIAVFKGRTDFSTTSYTFQFNKERFTFTAILYTPPGLDIKEDDVVVFDNRTFDVRSVVDPLYRQNHLEVLVQEQR